MAEEELSPRLTTSVTSLLSRYTLRQNLAGRDLVVHYDAQAPGHLGSHVRHIVANPRSQYATRLYYGSGSIVGCYDTDCRSSRRVFTVVAA